MGDSADKTVPLTYPDLRCLGEHAAKRFPDREFFLCADIKLPSVTGAELYGYCKKAAAALAEFTAELFVDRTLIPNQSAAWRIVSPINRSLASFKQIGEIVLRETEFEKTATRKIKRYKLIALS